MATFPFLSSLDQARFPSLDSASAALAALPVLGKLEKLFEIINKWEKATGMACNKAKTAIIPMGATRRKEVPKTLLRELKLPNPSEEPYEIYLGAPIGSDKTKYV